MLNTLRRQVFIPWKDARNKNYKLKYLPEVTAELSGTEAEIKAKQFARFQQIVRHAYETVPFYQNLYNNAGFHPDHLKSSSDVTRIPILTKDVFRKRNTELMSSKYKKETLIKTGTGGTTSTPIPLYYDHHCFSRKQACTLYFYKWFGHEIGERIAYLWRAEQDIPKNPTLKQKISNFLTDQILMLPSSYLNDEILLNFYHILKNFKPKILVSYPTSMFIFSNFLEKKGLRLKLPAICVVAEYLYEFQRKKIEEIFEQKIFNWYGARELGHIATESPEHRGMHVNTYGLYIEVVDKLHQPIQDTLGHILATDLLNDAMPLIRYKIEDMGILSSRKSAFSNLPVLEEIGGRYADVFRLRDGTYIPGVSFVNRIIKECRGIAKLQIIQKDYEEFVLNIVRGEDYSEKDVETLKDRINLYMHSNFNFKIEYIDDITPEPSGKIRFCKCELKESNDNHHV